MSILNVEHLTHGFGDRAIFSDVSFRLLKGEHIGLIGANGEGKSTFMNIITGKLQPDEGKVEWAKRVRVGYLDQHTVLEKDVYKRQGFHHLALADIMEIADQSVFLSFVRKAQDRIAIFFIAIFNSFYKSADRRHGLPPLSS